MVQEIIECRFLQSIEGKYKAQTYLPGRKGSIRTSAVEHNLVNIDAAFGFLKSRTRDFFPRLNVSKSASVFG